MFISKYSIYIDIIYILCGWVGVYIYEKFFLYTHINSYLMFRVSNAAQGRQPRGATGSSGSGLMANSCEMVMTAMSEGIHAYSLCPPMIFSILLESCAPH